MFEYSNVLRLFILEHFLDLIYVTLKVYLIIIINQVVLLRDSWYTIEYTIYLII